MNRIIPLNQKLTPTLYINMPDFTNDKSVNAVTSQINVNADKEDDDDDEGHIGTMETNKSEGEKLFYKKEYRKAIDCFTMALEIDPKNPDPRCFVWRSRCWLRLGRNEEALADAEASLSASQDNIHGLLIKAQVLFEIGDFEFALVQFHRGNKLRPELELFRKGIQCCEEVIVNCVGDSDHRLTLDGDLAFLDRVHPQIHFMDDEEKKKKENLNKNLNRNANRSAAIIKAIDGSVQGASSNANRNNEEGEEALNDDDDDAALDPLDAVAAANAGGEDSVERNDFVDADNNDSLVADTIPLDANNQAFDANGNNVNNNAVFDANGNNVNNNAFDVCRGDGTANMGSFVMETRKRTLPAFIYENAAYNAAEDDDDAASSASAAASPRFRTEAAVRAAIDDAASISSAELDNGNLNANANAREAAVAGAGGGGGGRVIVPEARRNVNVNCGICKRPPRTEKAKDEEGVRKWRQPKTCKMLLGELYKDRVYLESLLTDGDLIDPRYPVHKTTKREITKAINFLDSKADYWQRYRPIYARIGDKGQDKKRASGEELAMLIQRSLEEIDQAHNENRWEDCLSKARLLLANSSKWSAADIVNKRVVISALHNYMGVSYTELRRFDRGLREHIMDLEEVSKEPVLLDNKSRALENMGKVYAKMGNYTKALISWQQKEPLCKSDYENAWVCHEIGRAYLEMGNFARSRQSSIKAYKFAVACGDNIWMLHSSVLQAQTEAKMGELQAAHDTFGIALNHAVEVNDDQAATAIKRALKDIKLRLVRRGQGADAAATVGSDEEDRDAEEAEEEEEAEEAAGNADNGDGADDDADDDEIPDA